MHSLFSPRNLVLVAFGAIVAVSASGFAASNTVPGTIAGDGSGAVSGYTVSSVAYTLNSTNPGNVDAVAFTISPVTGTVKAKVAGNWYSCTNTAGSVSCTTTSPQATVASATTLQVVATQ